jgi:hypothetical protein
MVSHAESEDKPMTTRVVEIKYRADPRYARFLDSLAVAVRSRGVQLPEGDAPLIEYAVARLGFEHGLMAPPRMARGKGRPRKEVVE